MKIAVLGSGLQGTACAYDLCQNTDIIEVAITDMNEATLNKAFQKINSPKLTQHILDVTDQQALIEFLKPYDAVVSAVPYFLNFAITETAIAAGCHMTDFGGNTDLVRKQQSLDAEAKKAGVCILPDNGVAPGMANIIAVHGIKQFDEVESVHIRVGGLPQNPKPPMNYQMYFSMHGLLNEYLGKSVVLRDGKITEVDTLTELEEVEFEEPLGTLEAFHTLGGLSTLPWTYEGKIKTLDYKTMRYPGHCEQLRMLQALGLFELEPVEVDGQSVVPRNVFAACAEPRLSFDEVADIMPVRIEVYGKKMNSTLRWKMQIIDKYDPATGFTAMMRMTAFPASIVAQMMCDGRIPDRGVPELHTVVPKTAFIEELAKRNITLQADQRQYACSHGH